MGLVLYCLTSGILFFFASAILSIAICLGFCRNKIVQVIYRLFLIFGLLFTIIATTPISLWLYVFWAMAAIFYVIVFSISHITVKLKAAASMVFFSACAILFIAELPNYSMVKISLKHNKIYILGDSLTAGIGDKDVITYPHLINAKGKLQMIDLSVPGSRAENGIEMLKKVRSAHCPVLIELGGNDWRADSQGNVQRFCQGLENLLKRLCNGKRQVIMFEIPYPPFEYGFIYGQRRLAQKYGVTLIGKRFLASILFLQPNSTVDGIHLSQNGHKIFAKKLLQIFKLD